MITLGPIDFLEGSRVLITGGTGSLGQKLTHILLNGCATTTVVVFSRDEFKQYQMQQSLPPEHHARVRFMIGDVRDKDRLYRALKGVDYVIHAAALKHVPAAEYNPFEFVKTNILGGQNVICASIDCKVKKVVALSTDKAAEPANFYGATKLCSDKLFIAGSAYASGSGTRMAVVRYGNVVGSRGSVVPFFLEQRKRGHLPITDARMTRFWITLEQGAAMVVNALRDMQGQETFVPRIPSMRLTDLARTIAPDCELREVGVRPGEKLHETMIPRDAGHRAFAFEQHFVLLPDFPSPVEDFYRAQGVALMPRGFSYSSDTNDEWLSEEGLFRLIAGLDLPEAQEWLREHELQFHGNREHHPLRAAVG
jgi:UDP-N-acetylglucosamine 4,6-dehydratase